MTMTKKTKTHTYTGMSTVTKVVLLLVMAVSLVAGSVFATMAYLTSQDSVQNTFTAGDVTITLDEVVVDEYGVPTSTTRVKANEYKLIPGHSYTKDPTVHVAADSEDCWIFVKLTDGLKEIEDTLTILEQMTANGWSKVDGTTDIYAYRSIVSGGTDVPVFGTFKIKGDADVSAYAGTTIDVVSYAVQSDGFTTAKAAWDAADFSSPAPAGPEDH